MSQTSRAVIFVNGVIENGEWIKPYLHSSDFLVAVDGGYRHMKKIGLTPQLLVGDLDSIDEQDVKYLDAAGVEIKKLSVDKDETDLEIAFSTAIQRGYSTIRVIGAFGGRMDHWLANLFVLIDPIFHHHDIRYVNNKEEAFVIHDEAFIHGEPGDIVSLIPMGMVVHGVKTENLKYPLRSETLYPHQSRGVSNVMLTQYARVAIDNGLLLCIQLHKPFVECS